MPKLSKALRTLMIASFALGVVFLSAYGEPICNPYYTFYNECATTICRGGYGGTGPTLTILHYNPQMRDYEFPSEYYVGETYVLNGVVPNDNYCKKTTTVSQEYQKYKSNSENYTSTKYEDLKFSYVVQISKLGGNPTITYLDGFDGTVKPGDKKIHAFEWIPKEIGKYAVERSIFYDESGKIPLAPKHTTYVDVYGRQEQFSSILTPIEQHKYGLAVAKSRDNGLVVAIKTSDGMPVFLKPETREKLIERGWAKII